MGFSCYIIIGPSGSGKTTLASRLFKPEQKIVSYTTRLPRLDEKNHQAYHFISEKKFQAMIFANEFAEYDCYAENYYGVKKSELEALLKVNNCYDVLTAQGFLNLRKNYGQQIIPIYLQIDSDNLLNRLKKRGDHHQEIQIRLKLYQKEQKDLEKLKELPELILLDGNQPIETVFEEAKKYIANLEKQINRS